MAEMKNDKNKSSVDKNAEIDIPEFLQRRPNSNKVKQIQKTIIREGPLPIPQELEKYENICPGAADRIIKMAENQGAHRRNLEELSIKGAIRDSFLGLIFAFIISIFSIGGGIFLIFQDHSVLGTLFAGAGLATVVSAFLGTSHKK